ncbi:acyltransferase domain-containing protein [Sulfidibacter corallicola]|nr:acyltransferase domain-containing protein [Sulfidibacter corallicola]
MFSGQGAQFFHMGKELYEGEPVFRRALEACDELARPLLGQSLIDIVFDPSKKKSDPFDRLRHTHPGCFMLGYAMSELLRSKGIRPDFVLGYSLGEWNAAVEAGVFDVQEVIPLLVRQALTFEDKTVEAGMMAILGPPEMMQERASMFEGTWLSGINFATHFCVTGTFDRLDHIETSLSDEDIICQKLPVRRGFHSPLIENGRAGYFDGLSPAKEPRIPFFSGVAGGRVDFPDQAHFWRSCREAVQFEKAVQTLERMGPLRYVDLGPSGTLANFVKYGAGRISTSKTVNILTPFGRELSMLEKAVAALR